MVKFKKLLVYEGKKLLFFPFLYFIVTMTATAINLIGVWGFSKDGQYMYEQELTSLGLLYSFCGLLFFCVCYRVFATRELYEKVRVNMETLFFVRLICLTVACVVYTFFAALLGTVRVGALEYATDYPFVLTFYGKPWWYFLFFFSVALTLAVGYAIVELIANIVYCRMRVSVKLAAFLIPVLLLLFLHALPLATSDWATIGNGDYFASSLPLSAISWEQYGFFGANAPLCLVSWNICNTAMLLAALIVIAAGYFSSAFFGWKKNSSYLYPCKKEVKNCENND